MDCGVGERLLRLTKVLEQSKTSPETRTLRREQSFNFQVFQQTARTVDQSFCRNIAGSTQGVFTQLRGGAALRYTVERAAVGFDHHSVSHSASQHRTRCATHPALCS